PQRAGLAGLPTPERRAVVPAASDVRPAAAIRRPVDWPDERTGAVRSAHDLPGQRTTARRRRTARSRARHSGRYGWCNGRWDLAVRSNLDQAVASRLRAVLGDRVAAAEKQMHDRVDALINDKVGPVRARVNEVQTQAQAQIARQRARLDDLQKQLEQRLRDLT